MAMVATVSVECISMKVNGLCRNYNDEGVQSCCPKHACSQPSETTRAEES